MKQLKNIGVFLFRNWHWPDILTWHYATYATKYKNDPLMVNVKFACQLCQNWQPEMRLDYSDTKIIKIFIATNRFSHSWSHFHFIMWFKNFVNLTTLLLMVYITALL
jgi:hypothetical protein